MCSDALFQAGKVFSIFPRERAGLGVLGRVSAQLHSGVVVVEAVRRIVLIS